MGRVLPTLGLLLLGVLAPQRVEADGLVLKVGRGFLGDRETSEITVVIRDGKITDVREGSTATRSRSVGSYEPAPAPTLTSRFALTPNASRRSDAIRGSGRR